MQLRVCAGIDSCALSLCTVYSLAQHIGKLLLPKLTWHGSRSGRKVHLTFDDGPTPGVTDQVIDLLATHNVKATFFCLGRQVKQHPELVKKLVEQGHCVGNHGFAHLNGWATDRKRYLADAEEGQKALAELGIDAQFYRPAYGKANLSALPMLKDRYQRIVMWDLLPHDYNTQLSAEKVLHNAVSQVQAGSIIVLHDSDKAAPNMLAVLPQLLKHLSDKNYKFATLNEMEEIRK